MTLDDVYGPEHDRFPLEQERVAGLLPLDWSDACPQQSSPLERHEATTARAGAHRPRSPQIDWWRASVARVVG